MHLQEFNTTPSNQLKEFLLDCVAIESWANMLIERRPYISKTQILQMAQTLAHDWTWEDITSALAQHPKIGYKKAKKDLSERENTFSKQEQANVTLDENTHIQLQSYNTQYEEKFGFIFLIKAYGKSQTTILEHIQRRLQHSLQIEKELAKEELIQITLLRLDREITP